MYYRRKLLLSILEKAQNNNIQKINFQKFLFLVNKEQEKPCFDFIPYKYGCFSFQANRDLEVLSHHYQLIKNNEKKLAIGSRRKELF